jgi:hypothetical protein
MVMYKVSVQFTVYIEGLLLSVKENQHKFYSLVLLGFSCDFISCYKLESQPLCTLGDSPQGILYKKNWSLNQNDQKPKPISYSASCFYMGTKNQKIGLCHVFLFFYVGGCLALVRLFAFFSLNKIRAQAHSKKSRL